MSSDNQFIETYRQEAEELLAEIEETILEIEQNPEEMEGINRLFRAIHTIKGSGAMFGFDRIADFSHHVETVLDKMRSNIIPVTRPVIDLILASRDQIQFLLEEAAGGPATDKSARDRIIEALQSLMKETPAPQPQVEISPDIDREQDAILPSDKEIIVRIRFKPHEDIARTGYDPANILDDLVKLGDCTIITHTDAVPGLDALNAEKCYLYWDITLSTYQTIEAIRDVFIFVEDDSQIQLEVLDEMPESDENTPLPRVGEILVAKGDTTAEDVEQALKEQKRIGELLVQSGRVTKEKVQSALNEQKILDQRRIASKSSSVRVPSDKLDHLINLVGELVITQARLTQVASRSSDLELSSPVEEVERLTAELRDVVLNIRMLPIGTTFSKFKRLVRDLSKELGKTIDLVTEGAETELDKTVLERLNDPLVHLIRNSIDHGIEPPEARHENGKRKSGTISLIAAHKGANVVITIKDDGKGLDAEKIRKKAFEKGLISTDAKLSEQEIYNLIFAPGFSTADSVTSVSGRGVGMDVVKKEIDSLGGSISINSQLGKETAIHLSLPLTLAIIDGLLVKVAENHFVLPLSMIEECVELTRHQSRTTHGRNIIPVRDELVPFIRLREFFDLPGNAPEIEHIAIVQAEDLRVGIVVDHIIGDHQTVIKSLGKIYQEAEGVSGATIMGDGTVALILDIPELVRRAYREEISWVAQSLARTPLSVMH